VPGLNTSLGRGGATTSLMDLHFADASLIMGSNGAAHAKAMVTRRVRPYMIDGRRVHHLGLPWH
jgi:anaerobic selenocysteine-containing dehydrogenase